MTDILRGVAPPARHREIKRMTRPELVTEATRLRRELREAKRLRDHAADVPLGSLRRPWLQRYGICDIPVPRAVQFAIRKLWLAHKDDLDAFLAGTAALAARWAQPTGERDCYGRPRFACPFCGDRGQLGGFLAEGLRRHASADLSAAHCEVVFDLRREFRAEALRVPLFPEDPEGPEDLEDAGPTPQAGFVYLIRCTASGRLKIGLSIDPAARIRQLQLTSGAVLELVATRGVDDMNSAEAALHERFAHLRHHGEWFDPDPEILAAFTSEAPT